MQLSNFEMGKTYSVKKKDFSPPDGSALVLGKISLILVLAPASAENTVVFDGETSSTPLAQEVQSRQAFLRVKNSSNRVHLLDPETLEYAIEVPPEFAEDDVTFFVVDVEADGPAPGLFSMVSFGVVRVDAALETTFFGQTAPISEKWLPEDLAVSHVTREEHLSFEDPAKVMARLVVWLQANTVGKPVFISDNPAFDWQFINYYLHAYIGHNFFGHSARRIGDIYGGIMQDLHAGRKWRELIKTKPTHHPVVDAKGNAEAFLALLQGYNLLEKAQAQLVNSAPLPLDRATLARNLALLSNDNKVTMRILGEDGVAQTAKDALHLLNDYDEVLRGLAFNLSAGGYNSEGLIDPQVADAKIRWGIDDILDVESKRRTAEKAKALDLPSLRHKHEPEVL